MSAPATACPTNLASTIVTVTQNFESTNDFDGRVEKQMNIGRKYVTDDFFINQSKNSI